MERRLFFKSLLLLPTALAGLSKTNYFDQLPVFVDLSLMSVQWAIIEGMKKGYGKPCKLVIGPELLWMAREILGGSPMRVRYPELNCLYNDILAYEVRYSSKPHTWWIEFESGNVGSSGVGD